MGSSYPLSRAYPVFDPLYAPSSILDVPSSPLYGLLNLLCMFSLPPCPCQRRCVGTDTCDVCAPTSSTCVHRHLGRVCTDIRDVCAPTPDNTRGVCTDTNVMCVSDSTCFERPNLSSMCGLQTMWTNTTRLVQTVWMQGLYPAPIHCVDAY